MIYVAHDNSSSILFRVEQYIDAEKDKNIVDPDPSRLYTKRKQQRSSKDVSQSQGEETTSSITYPTDGWGTSLSRLPVFTRGEMNEYIARSGKNVGNKDHHSVPTTLRKAKTFLEDEYLHDISAASDQQCFYFKAKCCHSFRKNDPPHQLKLALCIVKGDVLHSSCTCVAGKVGFCNHISALMLKVCKFTLYEAKTTKDLQEENDENPVAACTLQLQKWHKKGSGENIVPQPVMEVIVKKTKLDEPSTSRGGVKCLLYEARKEPDYNAVSEHCFKTELAKIDANMGFAQMIQGDDPVPDITDTKFGKSPVGSYLAYQTSFTESNFCAEADLTAIPRNNVPLQNVDNYPRFPLSEEAEMVLPRALTDAEKSLIQNLSVDEDKIHSIESSSRDQADCSEWKEERKYRFTASSFQFIAKRQRNHANFAQSLIHPKPFSSKYVAHGIKYEPVALQEYEKFMFNRKTPVAVLKSGFVVSKSFPVLGATPDAKFVDFGCSICFGLAEVKCPHTKFNVTPLDACSDPDFFMEKIDEKHCRLKRNNAYYAQVQGQMGITGAKWCDFIVYTSKGLYVERIAFDPVFWQNLRNKLIQYYFEHFVSYAAADFQN